MALTAAGEEFARACEEMLEVYRKGVNNARTAAGDISGLVRFGLRRHIEEEYPNLRLELRFYSENGLLRALMTTWQTSSWLLAGPGRTTWGGRACPSARSAPCCPAATPWLGRGAELLSTAA